MTIFYYTDHSQKGDPFLFVVEVNSVAEAEKAFTEQTGIVAMKADNISVEAVFDQVLDIPGEYREPIEVVRCKHNQDINVTCGACQNEKNGKACRHGVKAVEYCDKCIIKLGE
jgi:hypothetical protein